MKRIIYRLFLILVAISSSCNREVDIVPSNKVHVTFDLNYIQKKSVSEDEKDRIRILDVFVFNSETGKLITYDRYSTNIVELFLLKDVTLECCFIANSEVDLSEVSSVEMLRNIVSQLADNEDFFVMQGSLKRKFNSDENIFLELSRLCSKISVDQLSMSFLNDEIIKQEVVLKRIFLSNVVGEIGLLSDVYEDAIIYNLNQFDSSVGRSVLDLVSKEFDRQIIDDSVLSLDVDLYGYSGSADTELIIEVDISGITNYYTVTLPDILPNYEYHIEEICLLGFGSSVPGVTLDRNEIRFSVMVNAWEYTDGRDTVMD